MATLLLGANDDRSGTVAPLRLAGARITAALSYSSTLVWLGICVLEGGVFGQRLTTQGGLRLPGAQWLSGLFLQGARLENTGGTPVCGDTCST
ncbi:hypothetical protein [Streptomyces luteolus]|uniref:Uncharacterized protein n=1 Tax=Streptomyces luteolus TaxID=3043615 RepID=A0ABT6T9H4_9ACTN|nr:hypothetical protein [Streptomyces sp. B-S-A12]MDI3424028.1 hypothetical protein [Streptomyces sp. B-S-A12]